jgi:ComF family protein
MMPVPLHKKRHLERGYNQTELVAKNLGEKLKICVNGKILIKNKNIKPQSQKTGEDRFKDVVGIYDLNPKYAQEIVGKKVLIFDDIYTTGSTCKECAKMLLQGGAKEVGIFCFARDHLRCEAYKSQNDR